MIVAVGLQPTAIHIVAVGLQPTAVPDVLSSPVQADTLAGCKPARTIKNS